MTAILIKQKKKRWVKQENREYLPDGEDERDAGHEGGEEQEEDQQGEDQCLVRRSKLRSTN